MEYKIYYVREALAALKRLSPDVRNRILRKVDRMRNGLSGDVKRLKAHTFEYRLRVGDWRILFEVAGKTIIIHDVKHRSNAYD